jgi:very-short-patch-repair endonuclease
VKRTKRSKLHKDVFRKLGLSKLGFKQERWIGPYRVDCVQYDHRIIVEVNGDAVHGNPRVFAANDNLPYGLKATEKWDQDAKRLDFLESHGWCVITVWESDDLKIKKELIEMALRIANIQ